MEIDKTTLSDLSVFNTEEEFSIFNYLDQTLTSNGKEQLRKDLSKPLSNIEAITGVQQTLRTILNKQGQWPKQISNGSIMVIERFYDANIDPIPTNAAAFTTYSYKLLHNPDFSLVKYSITHCFDFIKGMKQLINDHLNDDCPAPLKKILLEAKKITGNDRRNDRTATSNTNHEAGAGGANVGRKSKSDY